MTLDIDQLLLDLTLEEKAALTSGSGFWYTAPIDRLGIPKIMVSDGPHGLRAQPDSADHVGLGGSVPATCFPTASAIASSWNPGLLQEIGEALGREARAINLSVILGPGINMKRSPLCGRNFEYFSEDPYLAGELAVGLVDGIQSQGVGTSLKHFAANSQETDRLRVDAQVSERALREIYFPAFEKVVKTSQPWTVMCSYNKINGLSSSENPWLLTDVLRGEWGFDGLVVSDWGAVYHRVPALAAGLDLEMPPNLPRSPAQIVEAVDSGVVSAEVLDERVRTVLQLVSKSMHVLELDESVDVDAHHALARSAAAQSAVLLKNDGGLLPIAPGTRVAVIGEFARTPRFQGSGSSQVTPYRTENALGELTSIYGDVAFAAGYGIDETSDDESLRAEAVAAARDADVVVMFLGLPGADESEGFDRTHLNLPQSQLDTLAQVAEVNSKVVAVLVNGSAVVVTDVERSAGAILECWLGGQAAGGGIADVLSGRVNPSGRLAETIPHRLADNSSYLNFPGDSSIVRHGEGIFIGYRGYDASHLSVAYPFGFGLSYTTFEVSDLRVGTAGSVATDDLSAQVTVRVANTGPVAGAHVVQVYVRDVETTAARPVRELKGFARVQLQPGESSDVTITLDQRAFSFWSELLGGWAVEAGEFAVEVGAHSRDLALVETIAIEAPPVTAPIGPDSTLHEWAADPIAHGVMVAETARGGVNPLADEEMFRVIGNFPMTALASFPMGMYDHETLERLVAEVEALQTR